MGERGAMVIYLRRGEYIAIGNGIEIFISDANHYTAARLVVVAPKDIRVQRKVYTDEDYQNARREREDKGL